MNKHDIGGTISTEVRLNHTKNNTPVLNMIVTTADKVRNKDGESKTIKTNHRVTCWGKIAQTVFENYSKGDYIMVSGRSELKTTDKGIVSEVTVNQLENIHRTSSSKE